MKKFYLIGISLGTLMGIAFSWAFVETFAKDMRTINNQVQFNNLLTAHPELRKAKIRFVPRYAEVLIFCDSEEKGGECDYCPATYHINTKTIYIDKRVSPFYLRYNIFHEFGHFIYFRYLTHQERQAWLNICRMTPNHLSRYSKYSPEENFAEWYSIYLMGNGGYDTYAGINELFSSPQARFMNRVFRNFNLK